MKNPMLFIISSCLCVLSSFNLGYQVGKQHNKPVKITKVCTDERGLISVQYTQDGKEYAQDYLTETEYLKLINN